MERGADLPIASQSSPAWDETVSLWQIVLSHRCLLVPNILQPEN